jgi:hypothetical protein
VAKESNNTPRDNSFFVDSGATKHMTFLKDNFTTYKSLNPPRKVMVADSGQIQAIGIGEIRATFSTLSTTLKRVLKETLHVPRIN